MALTRLGPNQLINLTSNVTGTLATGNGGTGATSFAPGKVGQIIFGNTNVKVVGSGGGFVDTGLTASITPTATSSKILVLINQQFLKGNSTGGYVYMKLQRQIGGGGYSDQKYITSLGNYVAGDASGTAYIGANTFSGMLLDTTNTTSQVDYKTVSQNESWNEINPDDTSGAERGEADITLMEILA
jgi:hypothetical protein